MATAPKLAPDNDAAVLLIPYEDIDTTGRIGLYWPAWAEALSDLIKADGQRTPVPVRRNGPRANKPWTLIAGKHRVEAVHIAGLPYVRAIEEEGDDAELIQSQASENIERRNLAPIERALFVRAVADAAEARLKDQHGGLTQEQLAVQARWARMRSKAPGVEREDDLTESEADNTRLNLSRVYGWREETAETLGMSLASLKRDLALHRAIIAPFPDLYEALARHPIVGENASNLREIASFALPARRDIIEALVDAPDMTLAQALEGLGLSKPSAPAATGATKYMDNAGANIARLSAEQQRSWAPAFADTIKPSALEAMRDAIVARMQAEGLAVPAAPAAPAEKPTPAVPLRASVKPDYIVCLECGAREVQLKRHLRSAHGLQPGQYIAKWGLPADYPLVAPNHAEERREQAMKLGLKGGAK